MVRPTEPSGDLLCTHIRTARLGSVSQLSAGPGSFLAGVPGPPPCSSLCQHLLINFLQLSLHDLQDKVLEILRSPQHGLWIFGNGSG